MFLDATERLSMFCDREAKINVIAEMEEFENDVKV